LQIVKSDEMLYPVLEILFVFFRQHTLRSPEIFLFL
jgi:hypothetical protein